MRFRISVFLFLLLLSLGKMPASAQNNKQNNSSDTTRKEADGEDLMQMLDGEKDSLKGHNEYVSATFKATRVINGHSIENVAKGVLDFRIGHRFGTVNQGGKNFFGLDNATTRLGFDYGITNWLMVGIGRSTFEKEYDGFVKLKLLRQTTDNRMPVSLSYVGSIMDHTADVTLPDSTSKYYFSNRLSYCNQILIARKFSEALSIQLSPSHVHYNLVNKSSESNDIFAIGIGGRLKLSHRISLNAEYFYVVNPLDDTYNSLSVGIDIETGGHVFQLHFTNSTGMSERTFIGETTGQWGKGDIHFGFNISRVFTIVKPKEFRNTRNSIY